MLMIISIYNPNYTWQIDKLLLSVLYIVQLLRINLNCVNVLVVYSDHCADLEEVYKPILTSNH